MIKRLANGRWLAQVRPDGTKDGKIVKKRFATRGEAERWKVWIKNQAATQKEWNPQKTDTRLFSDLIAEWYKLAGVSLKSGAGRKSKLLHLAELWGDPLARHMDAAFFSQARAKRLESGISLNTVNHDLAYIKAMFNELRRAGSWPGENPLALVRKFKIDETEMAFLSFQQIDELLAQLARCQKRDAYLVAKLCLATGARWGESETITANAIKNGAVRFGNTKSGKGRTVPITPQLETELKTGRSGGFVRLFEPCMESFREALGRCSFTLPKGQATHVLRHTFASHFVQGGGDILTLQKVLGHSTINMTMRYSHLAPDHLRVVLNLNPLQLSKQAGNQ